MEAFEKELTHLINRHSIENVADMPDFLLAGMICRMIEAMGPSIKKTLDWHGCDSVCHPSPNVPVSSGAASAPYAPAAGSDDRCPTCRQRNSRAGEREMDDGSVIVWHCNVKGCANHADYPNAHPHGRAPARTVQGVVGSLDSE